jgi:hypothetical protein
MIHSEFCIDLKILLKSLEAPRMTIDQRGYLQGMPTAPSLEEISSLRMTSLKHQLAFLIRLRPQAEVIAYLIQAKESPPHLREKTHDDTLVNRILLSSLTQ